jgi:hypothetical protein
MARHNQAASAYSPMSGDARQLNLKRALAANALTETDLAFLATLLREEDFRAILTGRCTRRESAARILRKVQAQRAALKQAHEDLPSWAKPSRPRDRRSTP